ncbi:MAG: nucleotidyltransferase domain-containing protein [Phycisphaeraceae bacterium]
MIRLLEQYRKQIETLCGRYRVTQLMVFGSAARGDFDPRRSDVDLLVEFESMGPDDYAEAYFGLLDELQQLLGRSVELVTSRSIRNPYFREEVEQTGQKLYAA